MRSSRLPTDAATEPQLTADTHVVAKAVQKLQRQFGARRPVRAGSLILTIFGDAIAPRGGAITLGSLIRLAQPFGVQERLVRTSVSRLAQDGWLVAKRHGRRSEYRLTPEGEQRFAEATRRIYGRNPVRWDGQWTLLVLSPAGVREREELRWLGFGQIAQTLFAHPSADLEQARQWLKGVKLGPQVWLLKSTSEALSVDRELVARGWDLQELARGYRRFAGTFKPIGNALRAPVARSGGEARSAQSDRSAACFAAAGSPHSNTAGSADLPLSAQSAFLVRTLLIHEYRRIHLQDPLLPPILLPEGWIGSTAYELCRELYARVFPAAERHLSAMASRANDTLPAADPAVYSRFGGIPGA